MAKTKSSLTWIVIIALVLVLVLMYVNSSTEFYAQSNSNATKTLDTEVWMGKLTGTIWHHSKWDVTLEFLADKSGYLTINSKTRIPFQYLPNWIKLSPNDEALKTYNLMPSYQVNFNLDFDKEEVKDIDILSNDLVGGHYNFESRTPAIYRSVPGVMTTMQFMKDGTGKIQAYHLDQNFSGKFRWSENGTVTLEKQNDSYKFRVDPNTNTFRFFDTDGHELILH